MTSIDQSQALTDVADDTVVPIVPTTARRDFLQQLLAAGATVAGAGLLTGCASAAGAAGAAGAAPAMSSPSATPATAPAPPQAGALAAGAAGGAAQQTWDMSWTRRLARYKTAYDSPEIYDGAALAFASVAMAGYKQALAAADADLSPVLILRHTASVMVLNDAMWDRLTLGETHKLKDPTSGEHARRNPFIGWKDGDKHTLIGRNTGLDTLMSRGAIVLTCNNALRGVAYRLRQKETALTADAAMAEVRAAVLPGVYVMPNGIFAVSAAQDAGCHYMRVLV